MAHGRKRYQKYLKEQVHRTVEGIIPYKESELVLRVNVVESEHKAKRSEQKRRRGEDHVQQKYLEALELRYKNK